MKKFILFLLVFVSITCKAQVYNLTADAYAFKIGNADWSDWINTTCKINIDSDNDRVIIHSNNIQVYRILQLVSSNDRSIKWQMIDQDDDIGYLRLVRKGETIQIYIDFSGISWVYSIPTN